MKRTHSALVAAVSAYAIATTVHAHGFVGQRFFPPTLTTEDPFAVDELSFGTSFYIHPGEEGEPKSEEWATGFEFTKQVFPYFAIGVEGAYVREHEAGEGNNYGFENFAISLKYELWHSEKHEAIVSVGMETEIGGSGSGAIGESTTTFVPTLFFGKGFGDLPDSLDLLKPFAVTGQIGQTIRTDADEPNVLEWGFAVEYSLPYLQQHVRDLGLPGPIKSLIPICEFSFETTENRGRGITTGTINPGVLFETKSFQVGVEALIPVNTDSGRHVGVVLQVDLYLDDLLPQVFGRPVFGERQ